MDVSCLVLVAHPFTFSLINQTSLYLINQFPLACFSFMCPFNYVEMPDLLALIMSVYKPNYLYSIISCELSKLK